MLTCSFEETCAACCMLTPCLPNFLSTPCLPAPAGSAQCERACALHPGAAGGRGAGGGRLARPEGGPCHCPQAVCSHGPAVPHACHMHTAGEAVLGGRSCCCTGPGQSVWHESGKLRMRMAACAVYVCHICKASAAHAALCALVIAGRSKWQRRSSGQWGGTAHHPGRPQRAAGLYWHCEACFVGWLAVCPSLPWHLVCY